MSGKIRAWLVPLWLVLAVTVARAVPTVENYGTNLVERLLTPGSVVRSTARFSEVPITESGNHHLSRFASEFYSPPVSFSAQNLPEGAKSLPPVPSALLMVLAGFLCVSLVKDRRTWIAALASLLWAGHTSFSALPQLARYLSFSNHNKRRVCLNLDYKYRLDNLRRLRSEVEGTSYIGLLHHLAGIPDQWSAFKSKSIIGVSQNRSNSLSAFVSRQGRYYALFNCLAPEAGQFICFSPAFIFAHLARGPPILS